LPENPGIHWLADKEHVAMQSRITDLSQVGMPFIDTLASSDAVVTKVGYCMFVEAACNGVGLISAPRNDWPESTPLIEWAQQNARFALAEPDVEDAKGLRAALTKVLAEPRKELPIASGAAEACDAIAELIGLS
jgi:UDP:flavonoid glycosyltransferase YjiC (YdhE family)